MNVSSVKNLNGETFSAVQDAALTDIVQTNSGNWQDITAYQNASAGYLTAVDLSPYQTTAEMVNYYTTADANTMSGMLSGAIDYVSANAGDEFPASANEAITAYQNASGTYLTAHQDISNKLDTSAIDFVNGLDETYVRGISGKSIVANYALTAYQDELGRSITSHYAPRNVFTGVSADWNESTNYVQNNSATIDETVSTVESNSASWGQGGSTPTYDYTNNGLISAIDTSGLYATSAISALHLNQNGTMGVNILQSGAGNFYYMPAISPFGKPQGIFSPLQYATGACLAMDNSPFGAYFKGNEWYVSNNGIGQMLRGEVHNSRGVHLSGATTAGDNFNLGVRGVSGKYDDTKIWKLEYRGVSGFDGNAWRYGVEEDTALRTVSALEYNAVDEISGIAGSAIAQYGAEKQWLVHDGTLCHLANSAQYALGVNLSAVAQLLGVDETVLFSGSNYVSSCSLSEDLNNYKYIIVETPGASTHLCNERHTFKATNGIINLSYLAGANYPVIRNVRLSAYNSSLNVLSSVGITLGQWSGGNTATRYGNSDDLKSILAVYGVGRK